MKKPYGNAFDYLLWIRKEAKETYREKRRPYMINKDAAYGTAKKNKLFWDHDEMPNDVHCTKSHKILELRNIHKMSETKRIHIEYESATDSMWLAHHFNGMQIFFAEWVSEDKLRLILANGLELFIFDDGQSCCEARWITCDDDVKDLIGAVITQINVRTAPNYGEADDEDNYDINDIHECTFVILETNRGPFTMTTHNQHNGYYGGFNVVIEYQR